MNFVNLKLVNWNVCIVHKLDLCGNYLAAQQLLRQRVPYAQRALDALEERHLADVLPKGVALEEYLARPLVSNLVTRYRYRYHLAHK